MLTAFNKMKKEILLCRVSFFIERLAVKWRLFTSTLLINGDFLTLLPWKICIKQPKSFLPCTIWQSRVEN